jgi:hypothetical protein
MLQYLVYNNKYCYPFPVSSVAAQHVTNILV